MNTGVKIIGYTCSMRLAQGFDGKLFLATDRFTLWQVFHLVVFEVQGVPIPTGPVRLTLGARNY